MKRYIVLVLLVGPLLSFAQNKQMDSLLAVLAKQGDTSRVNTLLRISQSTGSGSLKHASEALSLSNAIEWPYGEARAALEMGLIFARQANFDSSLVYFQRCADVGKEYAMPEFEGRGKQYLGQVSQSLGEDYKSIDLLLQAKEHFIEAGDSVFLARSLNSLGSAYNGTGQQGEAIVYYMQAQEVFELTGNTGGYAGCLVNIGLVYSAMGEDQKALDNYMEALPVLKSIDHKQYLANTHHSIGVVYEKRNELDSALFYYGLSKVVFKELENWDYYGNALASIGDIHRTKGEYTKALGYHQEALDIKREIDEKAGVAGTLISLGKDVWEMGDRTKAAAYTEEALQLAGEIASLGYASSASLQLAEIYEELGKYRKAASFYKQHSDLEDSLYSLELAEKRAEMDARYMNEKKQREIELLKKENMIGELELAKSENKITRERTVRNSLVGGVALLLIVGFLLFNGIRNKRKHNVQLSSANEKLFERNKQVSDNIRYAKRIQEAMLPGEEQLKTLFPESFIVFKPKDMVSGDFYWCNRVDGSDLLAVADCTGHGVTGAFMSLIGYDTLGKIMIEDGVRELPKALSLLDAKVDTTLNKEGEKVKHYDGMEVGLCSFDRERSNMRFASAGRPLIIVRDGQLLEHPASFSSIGARLGSDRKEFKDQQIELRQGDAIYLFSDGYADQFAENTKKFKYRRFKEVLLEIAENAMDDQEKKLVDLFEGWKGSMPQIDDVCVIGIRV